MDKAGEDDQKRDFYHTGSGTEPVRAEALLAAIVENSVDAIVSKTIDGVITSWNAGAERMFGYSAEEAVGRPIHLIVPAELHDEEAAILAKLRRGERVAHFETTRIAKDGRALQVSLSVSPLVDAEGQVYGASKVARDVTEERRLERELRLREERTRLAAEAAAFGTFDVDLESRQNRWSAELLEIFGIDDRTIIPFEVAKSDWIHPEDAPRLEEKMRQSLDSSGSGTMMDEHRILRPDGEERWVFVQAKTHFIGEGEFRRPIRAVGTVIDVTQRKRTEQELVKSAAREADLRKLAEESEERFRTLADNIAQLAWMANEDGAIFWYNQRWFDYTGTTLEEVAGWGWRKVHHPEHVARVVEKIAWHFRHGEPWEDLFPLRSWDGGYRWFLSRALPIRDEAGRVVRWFGTNTDVTEQREAEQRLREADRRKDEFLAMLGHELRNPLAAIRSATELLKFARDDKKVLARARDVLERQSTHVSRLVDGLLEVSRISRGKIEVDREPMDLTEVLRGVLSDHRDALRRPGVNLELELPPEPVWVLGDAMRLVQVFDNLVGNATKFTEPFDTITVRLEHDGAQASVEVSDTGMGIRGELLPTIFEPFQQETQEIARSGGGLGLGLALAKGIVELHEGTIEAHSAGVGQGAMFRVTLPLTETPVRSAEASSENAGGEGRILLVEDNADAAEMLEALLQLLGYEVTTTNTGREALEAMRSRPFDLVLCDLGLPEMSGYQVAHAVRADEALRDLRLVALTGYGQSEDRRRSYAAGFDEHLTKPVEAAALRAALTRLLGSFSPEA